MAIKTLPATLRGVTFQGLVFNPQNVTPLLELQHGHGIETKLNW
jgi:hypothetical protein